MIITNISCNKHTFDTQQALPIMLSDVYQIDYDLTDDLTLLVEQGQVGTINFLVTQQAQAHVKIYCQSFVDLTVRCIMVSADTVDVRLSIFICGTESKVHVFGLSALYKNQSVVIATEQIHCGNNSQSSLILHALLTDQAQLRYEGMIRIEQDAFKTYALQQNKNILFSDHAHAISIPNIEVLNHDVQCYHGSAVGRFDKDQITYMQSRGLKESMIQQLLVQAFCQQVLQGYEKKDTILQSIYEKL